MALQDEAVPKVLRNPLVSMLAQIPSKNLIANAWDHRGKVVLFLIEVHHQLLIGHKIGRPGPRVVPLSIELPPSL